VRDIAPPEGAGHELQSEPNFGRRQLKALEKRRPSRRLAPNGNALLLGIKADFGDVNFAKSESFHNLAAHVFSFAFQYLVKISALYAILPRKSSLATLKFNHGSQ
jgi:hypothetical protein